MNEEERLNEMKQLFENADHLDPSIIGLVHTHFESIINMGLDIREHYSMSVYGMSEMVSHSEHRNFTFIGIKKNGHHEGEPCLILVSYAGIRYRPYGSSAWIDL